MEIYDHIAKDYHLKRRAPWGSFKGFYNELKNKMYKFNGFCIDLGCANGRHIKLLKNSHNKIIGIDNSIKLLEFANEVIHDFNLFPKKESNNIQLILGDILYIPFRKNSIDNMFSIASFHHIKNKINRKRVISQIFNQLKTNGFLILTIWRRWQKRFKKYFFYDWIKRKFKSKYRRIQIKASLEEFGDKLIPWTLSSEKRTYNRFYHFFSKKGIKKVLRIFKIKIFKIMGGPNNKDNFFILAQKQ